MKQSQLFIKTLKQAPKDEKSINARLLVRAGFVRKLMAGTYTFLPLGLRVHKKIESIIREEMNNIGGLEILMPALHPRKNWEITKRWNFPEMFKLKSRGDKDYSLGWTHEEVVVPLIKEFVQAYKDLPLYVYQIQDKFRDELRVKSGLLRGLEFTMKDLYSFHENEKDLDKYYEKVKKSYFRIFKRCGLEEQTFLTLASGGAFSKYSHEFQTITPFGEDNIYLCQKCKLAINKEIIKKENYQCSKCKSRKLEIKKAIEVGNIFNLKDKFTRAFNLKFKDKNGKEKRAVMGCYGIGISRLIGTIVEVHNDESGIIWPKETAPFQVHIVPIEISDSKNKKTSEKIYEDLQKAGIEVLYDDRKQKSAGQKLVEADLIGIPVRIVLSGKTLKKNSVEIKQRGETKIKLVKIRQLLQFLKHN